MLQVENLTKHYRGRAVVNGAGFVLRPGECLGIAGHNGSGKSTLMAMVAQVLPADAGQILCDGQNVMDNRDFLRTALGYVPQQNGLLEDLTVRQTLQFWRKAYGLPQSGLFAPGSPAALMGLEPLAKKRVGQLSGGMQKRLSVAIALQHNPRFVLLDEVLPALDRHYRDSLHQHLLAARRQGAGVLYCSHEVEDLRRFCDNILVLREGQTVFYGTAASFPTGAETLDVLMNQAPGASVG